MAIVPGIPEFQPLIPSLRYRHSSGTQTDVESTLEEMICFKRKTLLASGVCLLLASVLIYSYLNVQKYSLLPRIAAHKARVLCARAVTNRSISALLGNRSLVIAPYFDNRVEKLTRVIGIVHHEEVKEHYCWFCCPDTEEIYISKAVIDIHSDRFGFPYAAADLICQEPRICDPPYVWLQSSPKVDIRYLQQFEIKNRSPDKSPVEFTVCISTMFGGFNNVLQFIQSVEMYKLLGVKRVVIYKNSCSPLMEKVLEFYVAEGTVEIIPWPITSYLNVSRKWYFRDNGTEIGYYGQIAALNDCIYRNMYRSKYVLLNDIDEIILPHHHSSWKTMMESLEKKYPRTSVFLFENHIFPNTVFTANNVSIPAWKTVPGVDILQHIYREPDRKEVINPRKMIVNPREVVQTSVHSVLQAFGDSVNVPMDIAMTHHCRIPLQSKLPRESLIRDTRLWRFNSSLIKRVNQVLSNIPL